MDLDETWQVGLRPEKIKPCTFTAKSRYGFRREREKMGGDPMFFVTCKTHHLPLSFDRFPPCVPRTRVQVVARDTWFHIPEKFPSRGRISRKTVFFRTQKVILFVLRLPVSGNVLRCRNSFYPLVHIPQIHPSWVTFAEGCTVYPLSTSTQSHPLSQYH